MGKTEGTPYHQLLKTEKKPLAQKIVKWKYADGKGGDRKRPTQVERKARVRIVSKRQKTPGINHRKYQSPTRQERGNSSLVRRCLNGIRRA